jgi:hypothetical protein
MKKIIFLMTFLFCMSMHAQYFMYGYNIVPDEEVEHYLQNEKELYSKAAERAYKEGVINGWAIMRRVQGGKSEPNFYWYIGVDDLKKVDALGKDFGKIINETVEASGVPSLVKRAIKNHNSYTRFVATFYRPEVTTAKNSDGFKYLKHNVASSPNPNQWWDTQMKEWGPFIKKNMNNGKVNQEIWAPAVRINPTGNGYNWNVISIDGFNSLEDLFGNGGMQYPSMDSVDFDAISKTLPEGWYKTVIWERVMWLDNNGKFMD